MINFHLNLSNKNWDCKNIVKSTFWLRGHKFFAECVRMRQVFALATVRPSSKFKRRSRVREFLHTSEKYSTIFVWKSHFHTLTNVFLWMCECYVSTCLSHWLNFHLIKNFSCVMKITWTWSNFKRNSINKFQLNGKWHCCHQHQRHLCLVNGVQPFHNSVNE